MAQTAEQYFTELAKEAGYTEDQTKVLLELAKNDKVQAKVNGTLKTAQDDYQSQLGRVKAADDKVRAYDQWYGTTNAEYLKAVAERDALKQKFDSLNGTVDQTQQLDTSKFITKDDLLNTFKEFQGRTAGALKDLTRVATRHAAHFHEELDVDELEKIAQEGSLTITQAYQQMVGPRVEKDRMERTEKEKKEYAEQAVRDYASRNKLPVDSVPQESAPMYRTVDLKDMPKDMDGDLLAAWHGVK